MSVSTRAIGNTPKLELLLKELETFATYSEQYRGFVVTKQTHYKRPEVGKPLGYFHSDGYIETKIKGKSYLLHHLVWLWHYGEFPTDQIDHINQEKTDNRISNLRVVSNTINSRNKKLNNRNTSGFTGIHQNKTTGVWIARIEVDGKRIQLGQSYNKEVAIRYRQKYIEKHPELGFTVNHGKR